MLFRSVLDLGCGTGRDVYIVSKLVGESGHVIGVDMTPEQLSVAERHKDGQMKRFGYKVPNVEFLQGYIEDLGSLGIEDGSVDIVISNCVINLSPDKEKVFSEISRVLKKGGELYFSDVFADRRVPESVYRDPVICQCQKLRLIFFRNVKKILQKLQFFYPCKISAGCSLIST